MRVTDEDMVAVRLLMNPSYPLQEVFRAGDILYGYFYEQMGFRALRLSNKMHGLTGFTSLFEFSGGWPKDEYRQWRQLSPLEVLALQAE